MCIFKMYNVFAKITDSILEFCNDTLPHVNIIVINNNCLEKSRRNVWGLTASLPVPLVLMHR